MDDLIKQCSALFLSTYTGKQSELQSTVERFSLGEALQDNTSHPLSKNGDAIWERNDDTAPSDGATYNTLPSHRAPSKADRFTELANLDYSIDHSYQLVQRSLERLSLPGENCKDEALLVIASFLQNLESSAATARLVICASPDDTVLKAGIPQRCEQLEKEMTEISAVLRQRTGIAGTSAKEFDNTVLVPQFGGKDPLAVLAAFIVLALSVFGSIAREWANAALQLQLSLLHSIYVHFAPTGPSLYHKEVLDRFPRDIRTVRKMFELDPQTVTYAACPRCSTLYPHSPDTVLPVHCTARRFPKSPQCGAVISEMAVNNSPERHMWRVPIRPYVVQDFDAFKASLLNWPGMESLLDRGTTFNNSQDVWDIKDGTTIRQLKGPDGKPFFDGLPRNELRLAWALSIDWFNPFLNKISGRTASTGSVVMSCLNLPPSLRYKPENLYVVRIIPGPKEPSVDDFDHFLEPIVDFLHQSWKHGTKFSRTESAPQGRVERSILAVVVADLPGARKITGTASHSSISNFCSLCRLSKDAINNLDVNSWPRALPEFQKATAQAWRDVPNAATRNRIFSQYGIRWSSLWKLEYYDPSKMVIVDAMHNLFLGLVQFHLRKVLGIASPQDGGDEALSAVSDLDKDAAQATLQERKWKKLERFRKPILEFLCEEAGLGIDRRDTKEVLVNKLKKYMDVTPTSQEVLNKTPSTGPPAVDDLADLIGEEYVAECQKPEVFTDTVTKRELAQIRRNIQLVTRPQYRQGPPKNLGEKAHGKLRASQWKSAIEFDLPISVAMIWSRETSHKQDPTEVDRRDLFFQNIMHLGTAIRWGTSYRTSTLHASKYQEHMELYLRGLLSLYPDIRLRPNHHSALHIAENLLSFGPVQGWWMFPFERVIGKLQKINTNYKIGELEITMLKSFCAGASLKALIEGDHCPPALLPASSILKNQLNAQTAPDYPPDRTNAAFVGKSTKGTQHYLTSPASEAAFRSAFQAHSIDLGGWPAAVIVESFKHLDIGGVKFSIDAASRRDAEITFCPMGGKCRVSGVIESILGMKKDKQEVFVLGVRRRHPWMPSSGTPNPFVRFPDFGAELWSKELAKETEYVPLTEPLYHTQRMPWTSHYVVVKEIKPDF